MRVRHDGICTFSMTEVAHCHDGVCSPSDGICSHHDGKCTL